MHKRGPGWPRTRLFLQALEDRTLPAALVWYTGVNLPTATANAAAGQMYFGFNVGSRRVPQSSSRLQDRQNRRARRG
jgi:hypothetical protein